MTEAVEVKPVGAMNTKELKAEIVDGGWDVPSPVSVARLREIVAELRSTRDTPTPEAVAADEPEVVADVEVLDESGPDAPPTATVPPAVADEVETALALREPSVAPVLALPTPQEFNAAQSVALAIANTKMVPEAYRGRPDDVLAAILFGREIGLGPMTALRDIYMIDGRPALAAHRQLGALRRGGVEILESDSTDDGAWIIGRRKDTGEVMRVEFTWADAQAVVRKGKALVDGENWKNYRKDMLWARCVGRLTRRLGPDLIGGLPPYVAEEVADFSGWGVEYGAHGEVRVGQFATNTPPPDPIRQEYPEFNAPSSWAELMPRLGSRIGEADATEWVRQATVAFGGVDTMATLSVEKRKTLFRKCVHVLAALENHEGDLGFDPNVRAVVAAAFAPRLDGQILEGPPWRVSPTEHDRPVYLDWVAANPFPEAPADAVTPEPESIEDAVIVEPTEEEDIPFGEDDDPSGGYGG